MNARSIVGFMDAPQVLDASVTNIPGSGSSPVQVVSAMPNISLHVHFYDGMGRYVGIYKGAVGKESLVCIVGGGGSDQKPCNLSASATAARMGDVVVNIEGASRGQHSMINATTSEADRVVIMFPQPIPVQAGQLVSITTTPASTTSTAWVGNLYGYEK